MTYTQRSQAFLASRTVKKLKNNHGHLDYRNRNLSIYIYIYIYIYITQGNFLVDIAPTRNSD